MRGYILATLALACGPAGGTPGAPVGATVFWANDAGLRALVESGTARLAAATGRPDIETRIDGVPVEYVEDPTDAGGTRACAITWKDGAGFVHDIVIDPTPAPLRCLTPPAVVVHELMHALAPFAEHTERGLFALHANADATRIDEAALMQVCAKFECLAFNPE